MSISLIKNISNQGLHLTFGRKIMMTVFSYGNNQKDPHFRQASNVFRIAGHPLPPHANHIANEDPVLIWKRDSFTRT